MKKSILYLVFCSLSLVGMMSCENSTENLTSEQGERNLDSLLAITPNDVSLLLERGNKLFARYEYDLALNDAAKAFRLDSNNIETRLLYAEVLNNREQRTTQEVEIAQKHYKWVIKKDAKSLRALVGLAGTYGFQQDFEKVFLYANEALRIDSKYRDAYVIKGSTYLLLGKVDLAKSSYQTAIQQDPKFFEAYFLLGQIYQSENDPLCIEYFNTAHELYPEQMEFTYQLAYSKQMFNQYESAKEIYRIMAQDTSDLYVSRALFHQGYLHQFVDKNIDSAKYFYISAIETEPRMYEAWHNLGMCHEAKGDRLKAIQSYATALKHNPEFTISRDAAERLR